MKQFEKWFKKHKPYEVYSCMGMAEDAWRAALKWVLDSVCSEQDGYRAHLIAEDIKEELHEN